MTYQKKVVKISLLHLSIGLNNFFGMGSTHFKNKIEGHLQVLNQPKHDIFVAVYWLLNHEIFAAK